MLYQVLPGAVLDRHLAAFNPEYPLLMRCWLAWDDIDLPRIRLVDDLESPRVFVGGVADWLNIIGEEDIYESALQDLFDVKIKPFRVWPNDDTRDRWVERNDNQPYLRLEGHGERIHEVAHRLGLVQTVNKVEEDGAFFYYFTGEPRLADEIKHPCRVVKGLELWDLMRQGIDYDKSGEYTRQCLEAGPSFVCEIDGEPVCWSCTHAGRAVGMIYTPEEHRRNGYARSLAALQIDHMLKVDGIAWAAILGTNTASQRLVESLGAKRMEGQMYWRRYNLPMSEAASGIGGVH